MSRIIAAVDSSLAARPVLAMARAVAPFFAAEVQAVHVVENGDETARAEAEAACVPRRWLAGDPLEQLAAVLGEDDAVALVIGAHRHAVGGHVGHLPLELASTTDKPVIVVQPTAAPPERLRRVVVALEGTLTRAKELKRAIRLIDASGLEITVVHVDDEDSVPRFSDQIQHESESYAHEFFARFLPGLSHARLELRVGVAADEILGVTRAMGGELLAVGWPQADQHERGRVARELLERSPVPVLLVAVA